MTRYIAFLRAINVGGHTVKMDKLRGLFEELGFANVATFIASGNVIFDSPERDARRLEERIEGHLHEALGYEVTTFLRTTSELAEIARYRPFPDAELDDPGNTLYVSFLQERPDAGAEERLDECRTDIDEFHLHGREMYWLCRKTISQSTITGAQLARAAGQPLTMRNVKTLRRLAAKYPPPA